MTSPSNEPEWLAILRADAAATGSISKTAQRVGISRSAVSQILNCCGPYGTGKADTSKVAEKVMNTIGLVECPFLSEYHGKEHRITGLQCREYAYRESAPTNSPREMQHWRACQTCPKRVKRGTQASVPGKPPRKTADVDEPPQQAGVIDKVTLPLPEVGGPLIQDNNEGRTE